MKKLISIGVALALLTMAVVPGAVGAYTEPASFAKTPFAIIQSMMDLAASLVPALEAVMGPLPLPLDTMLPEIGEWAGGPLSWTVDMLAWGLDLGATIFATLDSALGLGMPWIGDLLSDVACGLFTPFTTNITGPPFAPCG